jgi:hypothetical protein
VFSVTSKNNSKREEEREREGERREGQVQREEKGNKLNAKPV